MENDTRFQIQVDGERVSVPRTASFTVEHERGASGEEIEFQLAWPTGK